MTVVCLEMASPDQLVPARPAAGRLNLERVDVRAAAVLRDAYVRIGEPHGWTGRTGWTTAQWREELERPGVEAWLARVDREVAGFVELEAEANGDVGIVVLGLFPEFVGRGLGGVLLTEATRIAWTLGSPTRRVWVQTTSTDHPHALRNYESRGFRIFRSEPAA
jgi:GNAT superfamily N-acetyltransferase